jgi:DNA-binding CsgD family transcriptional regulator/tetratricopeptide (TPR) repeat protein
LCLIDDAQWLDQVSVQTLGFVARRLVAEPVALVFAVRACGGDVLVGLPQLVVAGLPDADARELLDSVTLGRIDPRVRDRVVAETRGVPLALLEVPRNVPAAELAGGFWNVDVRPSAGEVEEGFVRRIQSMPGPTRKLLLAAAAEPVGDAALFLRAAALLDIPVDALAPAEAAGVIEFGPRLRFHHPLVRSAAYRAASLGDRRAIHRALADATDPHTDPDRRAWHAANAVAGPDDAVGDELEASAGRAQSRGGVAAAASFLERAAILTSDPVLRASRAIAAAQGKRDAAAPAAAYELLALAERGTLSDLQRAQVARLRAQMEFTRRRGGDTNAVAFGDAALQLLDAARRFEGRDDDVARETYLEALAAAMFAGRLGAPGVVVTVAEAARAAGERLPPSPMAVDALLRAIAIRITGGVSAGSGPLRAALALMCAQAQADDGHVMRWLVPAFPVLQESSAHELWEEPVAHQLATTVVRRARDAGALAILPQALVYLAGVHLLAGEFATAATLVEEAISITSATEHSAPLRYHSLLLAAWRGTAGDAVGMIEAAAAQGAARGEGRVLGLTGYAAAVLFNGLGRYEEALQAARRACDYEDLGFYGWCLTELIEAAVHSGETEEAGLAIRELEDRTLASGTEWALGALASARALLADDERAEALHVEAIERLARTRVVVHLARAHLRYGEWLRRANRRVDARKQLNTAYETFTRIGAVAFAERARRELIGSGEKARKHPVGSGDELTAQEEQIARLAGDGLTNQEIGARLFISTHTVEWHLRKVFVKLGITSRRQLRTISWAG